jgi:hypothetical protein
METPVKEEPVMQEPVKEEPGRRNYAGSGIFR